MTDTTISLTMLAIFLAGTLWLGMVHKKDNPGIREYTIGNKTFTTAALIATVLATNYGGGGIIRSVEMIYTYGLWFVMLMIGRTTIAYLSRIVVSHRVGVFMEHHVDANSHISMADTIGKVYGKIPRIITALATVCVVIVDVATQITVTSKILQTLISGVNPTILIVISASIVVLYSTLGGIQSVTITDILQCATFTIMIPCITYKVFHHTGMTLPQILKAVSQSEQFQFAPIWQSKTKILSLIAIYMAYFGVDPASVQRMYMARNSQQAREAYCFSAILDLSILLIIAFLGLVTYVGYSHITDPSMIWPAIVSDSSAVFKGFFAISLFAMAMSTADSCLNVGSSMLAYHIVKPLRKNRLTDKQQLYLAKVACFAIGIFSIFLSLSVSKYKDALFRLLFLAIDIGNPVMTAPFLLAVWGFRCKEKIAVLGMAVGIVTITLWKKFIPNINGSFVAMLANGITMLWVHCSLPAKDRKDWQKPNSNYQ